MVELGYRDAREALEGAGLASRRHVA
jgi:hypothetical protein